MAAIDTIQSIRQFLGAFAKVPKIKIQSSGADTYVGFTTPGQLEASAVWVAIKIGSDGLVLHADGNLNADNVATNLAALSYS